MGISDDEGDDDGDVDDEDDDEYGVRIFAREGVKALLSNKKQRQNTMVAIVARSWRLIATATSI